MDSPQESNALWRIKSQTKTSLSFGEFLFLQTNCFQIERESGNDTTEFPWQYHSLAHPLGPGCLAQRQQTTFKVLHNNILIAKVCTIIALRDGKDGIPIYGVVNHSHARQTHCQQNTTTSWLTRIRTLLWDHIKCAFYRHRKFKFYRRPHKRPTNIFSVPQYYTE